MTEGSTVRKIVLAIIITMGFLSFLWLEKPFREFLSQDLLDLQFAKQVSGIIVRLMLIILAIVAINRLQHFRFTGLNRWKNVKNIRAIIIPIIFIVLGVSSNWSTYSQAETKLVLLFAISTMAVGFVEEFVFRGAIFPLCIKAFKKTNRPIVLSAIVSSLMFGIVHFVNLFSQPENIMGITSQVFFATSIGVFFCGLMVRTENIVIPCIIHALVNFSFGADELVQTSEELTHTGIEAGINWGSLVPTTLFFTFILLGGIYMIRKSDKKIILDSLNSD